MIELAITSASFAPRTAAASAARLGRSSFQASM
jgi:hypothetical protein